MKKIQRKAPLLPFLFFVISALYFASENETSASAQELATNNAEIETGTGTHRPRRREFDLTKNTVSELISRISSISEPQDRLIAYSHLWEEIKHAEHSNMSDMKVMATALASEYFRRNEPNGFGLHSPNISNLVTEFELYRTTVSDELRTFLESQIEGVNVQIDPEELLLFGIFDITGSKELSLNIYESSVREQLANHVEMSNPSAQRLFDTQSREFIATVLSARAGNSEAVHSVILALEMLPSHYRGREFRWLKLIDSPEVVQYLLGYAFSDQLPVGGGDVVSSPLADPAIQALASMNSDFPPPIFIEIGHTVRELGRPWLVENMEPEVLEAAGINPDDYRQQP